MRLDVSAMDAEGLRYETSLTTIWPPWWKSNFGAFAAKTVATLASNTYLGERGSGKGPRVLASTFNARYFCSVWGLSGIAEHLLSMQRQWMVGSSRWAEL